MFIHKHTFVLLCAKHWNITLIHQSPNKPWFNWNNPEIAFHFCDPWVDILPPRNAEMPICKIRWVARRGMLEGPNLPIRKTSMTGALASRWIYWILRAGKSFPKNVIKTAILEFQFCKSTLPKLTVSLRYPYFWKQHFPDSYSFIAGLKFEIWYVFHFRNPLGLCSWSFFQVSDVRCGGISCKPYSFLSSLWWQLQPLLVEQSWCCHSWEALVRRDSWSVNGEW